MGDPDFAIFAHSSLQKCSESVRLHLLCAALVAWPQEFLRLLSYCFFTSWKPPQEGFFFHHFINFGGTSSSWSCHYCAIFSPIDDDNVPQCSMMHLIEFFWALLLLSLSTRRSVWGFGWWLDHSIWGSEKKMWQVILSSATSPIMEQGAHNFLNLLLSPRKF